MFRIQLDLVRQSQSQVEGTKQDGVRHPQRILWYMPYLDRDVVLCREWHQMRSGLHMPE